MTRQLPPRPDLDQLRRQAKDLQHAACAGDADALQRIRVVGEAVSLTSAQLAMAREHGFASWAALNAEIQRRHFLDRGDVAGLTQLITEQPGLATSAFTGWCDHRIPPLSYVA